MELSEEKHFKSYKSKLIKKKFTNVPIRFIIWLNV